MTDVRHDWRRGKVEALFEAPMNDLLFHPGGAPTTPNPTFDEDRTMFERLGPAPRPAAAS